MDDKTGIDFAKTMQSKGLQRCSIVKRCLEGKNTIRDHADLFAGVSRRWDQLTHQERVSERWLNPGLLVYIMQSSFREIQDACGGKTVQRLSLVERTSLGVMSCRDLADLLWSIVDRWDELTPQQRASGEHLNPDLPVYIVQPPLEDLAHLVVYR